MHTLKKENNNWIVRGGRTFSLVGSEIEAFFFNSRTELKFR